MSSLLLFDSIIQELSVNKKTVVFLHGWHVLLEYGPEGLAISAPIYKGDNYIPAGVREAIQGSLFSGRSFLKTHFSLEEQNFTITIHSHILTPSLNQEFLSPLLEEFSWVAEQWWRHLDDRDQQDLVYIHRRR